MTINSQFELQVCPNGRSKADEYLHQGSIWIEGREGSNYILRFINRSPNKVAVIFSVDGLDTIKGEPAGLNSDSYIVNANDSLEVPGWLLNNSSAAEFYFAKAGHSYVAASGNNTAHTGVIGAMVFREKVVYPAWSPTWPWHGTPIPFTPTWPYTVCNTVYNAQNSTKEIADDATVASAESSGILRGAGSTGGAINNMMAQNMGQMSMTSQDVGTGFGNPTEFNTTSIAFTRANPTVPDAILAIYYNTAKNLQRMGINIRTIHNKYDSSNANPFPAYQSSTGCQPPPGWKS
jgi:hypothetical protein